MNYLKTAALLAVLTAVFVFFGSMLGGTNGAIVALVIAGLMNFVTYWFSDKIVLAMYGGKQVDESDAPGLHAIVRDLSTKAGMPMPKVYMMDNPTPNAFATGRNPSHAAVAVTSGIMNILNKDELSGVIGHELAHIRNRDILIATIAATIAGAVSYLAQLAYFASFFAGSRRDEGEGGNPFVLIAMAVIAPIAAMIIQMAISRSREYGADTTGAQIAGNPLHLASALKKLEYYNRRVPLEGAKEATAHMFIVSPLSGKSMLKLFSTHPPIEERVKRLEAMAYPNRG